MSAVDTYIETETERVERWRMGELLRVGFRLTRLTSGHDPRLRQPSERGVEFDTEPLSAVLLGGDGRRPRADERVEHDAWLP